MRERPTTRLLLINQQQEILLIQYEDKVALNPATPDLRIYWGTPGGGVEPGESFEEAGLRELWEETGIRRSELGPCVWHRERILRFAERDVKFVEHYYLVFVDDNGTSQDNLLAHELLTHRDYRWWSLDSLRRSDEVFFPTGLVDLLEPLLRGTIPAEPLHISV